MIQEGGRTKSHRYWPKLGSKHSSATYGKFKVTTKFRTDSGCYATTGLKVKHLLSGQERTVWHLQYTDWPHHGCPEDVQGFLCELVFPSLSFAECVSSLSVEWTMAMPTLKRLECYHTEVPSPLHRTEKSKKCLILLTSYASL